MTMRSALSWLLAPFPSFLKVPLYRTLLGYRIGANVRIGFSVIDVKEADISDRVRIGHFNFVSRIRNLAIGADAVLGHFNLLVGGHKVSLGEGSMIGRFNEINSIIDPLIRGEADPSLVVGTQAVITAWHKIDFTDRIEIGESAIIAGRHSCLWTHNRQQVKPVRVGDHCYVGSGVQFAPGTEVGSHCVVGLGSVVTKPILEEYFLVAGVPARPIRPLEEDDRDLVEFSTRPDLDAAGKLP